MRTTLDIDEDVLAAARELARADGRTMGEVISDLARRALIQPAPTGMSEAQADFEDDLFPRFPKRGGPPVTNELIRRIQDEIDMEDSVPFDHETGKPRVFPDHS
jgi:hypothetical protein